ncbi:iron-sulfur cluster repair di-iron protein [Alkalicella caledoniensis]|uniref:Iron-sulfur cluster repair di-iron protein n=1 Tax=Alkalicella caledoniensis TaxID=2731377 RepID=A0A7G9W5G5_ALKCA|nr:iron-sulfur cluster repair di-iron protein [Alkalicella caledoniensis]QNO13927.1 iron-sulfur cluster repair di-iron protein [Alkalicella caledoniensis]
MTTFNKKQKIGRIAGTFSKAKEILKEFEVDFCCGGDRLLEVALVKQNIDENAIISRLNAEYDKFIASMEKETNWREASLADLIQYIEDKHHTFMKQELPVTDAYLKKILAVHFEENGEMLLQLNKMFSALKAELEEHLIKEEVSLFPLIKKYEQDPTQENLDKVFKVMEETESEHDAAGDILKAMRKITEGYKVPEDTCPTFETTYAKIKAIENDLFNHIHLENNVLFDRLK